MMTTTNALCTTSIGLAAHMETSLITFITTARLS